MEGRGGAGESFIMYCRLYVKAVGNGGRVCVCVSVFGVVGS